MGYQLNALIGRKSALSQLADKFISACIIELEQGICLIPMTLNLFDEINQNCISEDIGDFSFLTTNVEQQILQAVPDSSIAYIEADHFGGSGKQQSIVWENGKRRKLYKAGDDAINLVLLDLGIVVQHEKDAFTTLGLDQHRDTEDWLP